MRRILSVFSETIEYLREDRERTVDVFAIVVTTFLVATIVAVFPILLVAGTEWQDRTVPIILAAAFSAAVVISFARVLGEVSDARENYAVDELAMKRRERKFKAELLEQVVGGVARKEDTMKMGNEERAKAHETILGVLRQTKNEKDRADAAEKRAAYEQARADKEKARADYLAFEMEKAKVLVPAAAEIGLRAGQGQSAPGAAARRKRAVNPAAFPAARPSDTVEITFEAAAQYAAENNCRASSDEEALAEAAQEELVISAPAVKDLAEGQPDLRAEVAEFVVEDTVKDHDLSATWLELRNYWLYGKNEQSVELVEDGEELEIDLSPLYRARFCA